MKGVETKAEYEALIDTICLHDRLYYQECSPEISDDAYDKLVLSLEETEREHPEWISKTSPTQRIAEKPLSGFEEVGHTEPMLSLEKVFSNEELKEFHDRVKKLLHKEDVALCGELKLDGLAVSVTYEKGCFARAVTRGDGKVGSDVTNNVKTIRNLPLRLADDVEDVVELRGEVFLPKKAFEQLNAERKKNNEPLWANPRNAAAGSLKLLDAKEVGKRSNLSVCFYGIVQGLPTSIKGQYELQAWIKKQGLPTTDTILAHEKLRLSSIALCHTIDEMALFAKMIEVHRDELPFGIDGIVFKVDDIRDGIQLGTTAKHPRNACALKFSAENAWTYVNGITYQVGRTGVITPVAELDPVFLAGSTISRASLHNFDEVARLDVRIGDYVLIAKGGDVIPKVLEVDASKRNEHSVKLQPPQVCPCCGTLLIKDAEEVALRCPNSQECLDQVHKRLTHFVGKDGLDIDHVGDKLIEQLVQRGLVRKPSDLFKLRKDDLAKLQGFKEKSIANVLASIEKAKKTTMDRLLTALGIRYVGTQAAEALSCVFHTLPELMGKNADELKIIPGIGEKVAASLVAYFRIQENKDELQALLATGIELEKNIVASDGTHPLYQKHVVLTGTLEKMTRQEATRLLKEKGALVSDTVTKKTDFLIVGADAGSKLEKAKKLAIPILTENELIHVLQPVFDG